MDLWFGEVKFHMNYTGAINSALKEMVVSNYHLYCRQNIYSQNFIPLLTELVMLMTLLRVYANF